MRRRITALGVFLALAILCPFALSQQNSQAKKSSDDAQQRNIQEYIELIKSNVRQEKAQVLGAVMQLDSGDAAQFWPIYNQYDAELAKLSKMRSDNILEYAAAYDSLTDEKADELIKRGIEYQKLRSDLLIKYYEKMKKSVGSITAARFLQVENQLLLIIDLQIAANLPLAEADMKLAEGEKK